MNFDIQLLPLSGIKVTKLWLNTQPNSIICSLVLLIYAIFYSAKSETGYREADCRLPNFLESHESHK